MWQGCAEYFLLPLVARCIETIDGCIYMAQVCFMSVVVNVCGLYDCLLCSSRC